MPESYGVLLADVLVPEIGMRRDELAEHPDALLRVQVDDLDAVLGEPPFAALEVHRLAEHDLRNPELPHQAAAVPAGRERRDHHRVAIAALAAGIAESIRLAVHRGVVLLDAAAVGTSQP